MIVGIHGFKQSGKDTFATMLQELDPEIERCAFATPLKQAVASLFNVSLEDLEILKNDDVRESCIEVHAGFETKTFSWRHILQRMGTEVGRELWGSNFWVNQVFPPNTDTNPARKVVVTDVRFPNEAERIRDLGGFVIEIVRPGIDSDAHASEVRLPQELILLTVNNAGSLDSLRDIAQAVYNSYLYG